MVLSPQVIVILFPQYWWLCLSYANGSISKVLMVILPKYWWFYFPSTYGSIFQMLMVLFPSTDGSIPKQIVKPWLSLCFTDSRYKHPHMGFFKKVNDIWGEDLVVGQSAGTAEDTGQWQGIGLAAIQEWGKFNSTAGISSIYQHYWNKVSSSTLQE